MRESTTERRAAERETLVAALRARGVGFYAPSDAAEADPPLGSLELLVGLASSRDPRVRDALVALFLRRPELSGDVPGAVDSLDSAGARALRIRYTAAVCLQRMWKSTLSMYLPHAEMLPDLYGDSLDLPSRDEHFGERALRDLAARSDYDQLSAWSAVVDQLLSELSRESVGEFATTS